MIGIFMHVCKMKPLTQFLVNYWPILFLIAFSPFFCHFTVIELSAEIANLQTAILNTRQDLKHLMKNKHSLLEKASAAQLDKLTD